MKHLWMRTRQWIMLTLFVMLNGLIMVESLIPGGPSGQQSDSIVNVLVDFINGTFTRPAMIIEPTEVTLTGPTEVPIGQTRRFTSVVLPEDTTDKSIRWSSSDLSVGRITSGGYFEAKTLGVTTIKAMTSKDAIYHEQVVEVVPLPAPTSFTMELSKTAIYIDTTAKVKLFSVEPTYADVSSLTYLSTNPLVASVDENGVVRGEENGQATIYVDGYLSQGVAVTVTTSPDPIVFPTTLSIEGPSSGYNYRDTALVANFGDITPSDTAITWISSNPFIARVSDSGVVTGGKFSGTVTITAISDMDPSIFVTHQFEVAPVLPLTLGISALKNELEVGKQLTLIPTFDPVDVTNKELTFVSSNPTIATVQSINGQGRVIGKAMGIVTITATSQADPTIQGTIELTIIPTPVIGDEDIGDFSTFVRKTIGHYLLFFVNGLVGFFTFYYFRKDDHWPAMIFLISIGAIFSGLSELLQLITPGRGARLLDVGINFLGFISAVAMLLFANLFYRKALDRKVKKVSQNR